MSDTRRTSKEQFDRQAVHYNAEWNTWSQETLDWLLEQGQPSASDIVLDVATGTGFTAIAFAAAAKEVVATDISTGMLEQAKQSALAAGVNNIRFMEAPAEDLPFDSETFDIVTCRIAAHHFVGIKEFAAEVFRVLKKGGRLVIADTSVPDDDFLAAVWQNEVERMRDTSHGKNYTVNEWRKILTRPGFQIVSISDSGSGIRIPLSSWISKAGCSEEQEAEVRGKFSEAPENIRRKFNIETDDQGETWFTWLRVLIKATK
jgi:ubiquinone/menaquinone biosynthesis C-methylase UbiE